LIFNHQETETMTTATQDATQTGATDDSTTTVEQPSARELAMEAIAGLRQDSFDVEARGEQSGSKEATQQDAQIAAQMNDLLASLDAQVVKVKIDGVESEVTVSEMRRQYQKNGAAERRLEEATRLLNEARTTKESAPAPLRFAQDEKKSDSDGQEGGKALLEALFAGDESKALEELNRFGIGRSQEAPTLDVVQIAAQITPAIKQQLIVESALDAFEAKFADVMADPYLEGMAAGFIKQEVDGGMPFVDALEIGGKKTRDWLASKGVTTPETNPTIDRNTKLERKAGMDKIPALNSKATTADVPEPSASDVITEMRRARGLDG
jgi:hypothetical protein